MLGWKLSHSTLVPPITLPCWVNSFLESSPFPPVPQCPREEGRARDKPRKGQPFCLYSPLPRPALLLGDINYRYLVLLRIPSVLTTHPLPMEAVCMGKKNHSKEPRRGRRETCLCKSLPRGDRQTGAVGRTGGQACRRQGQPGSWGGVSGLLVSGRGRRPVAQGLDAALPGLIV